MEDIALLNEVGEEKERTVEKYVTMFINTLDESQVEYFDTYYQSLTLDILNKIIENYNAKFDAIRNNKKTQQEIFDTLNTYSLVYRGGSTIDFFQYLTKQFPKISEEVIIEMVDVVKTFFRFLSQTDFLTVYFNNELKEIKEIMLRPIEINLGFEIGMKKYGSVSSASFNSVGEDPTTMEYVLNINNVTDDRIFDMCWDNPVKYAKFEETTIFNSFKTYYRVINGIVSSKESYDDFVRKTCECKTKPGKLKSCLENYKKLFFVFPYAKIGNYLIKKMFKQYEESNFKIHYVTEVTLPNVVKFNVQHTLHFTPAKIYSSLTLISPFTTLANAKTKVTY